MVQDDRNAVFDDLSCLKRSTVGCNNIHAGGPSQSRTNNASNARVKNETKAPSRVFSESLWRAEGPGRVPGLRGRPALRGGQRAPTRSRACSDTPPFRSWASLQVAGFKALRSVSLTLARAQDARLCVCSPLCSRGAAPALRLVRRRAPDLGDGSGVRCSSPSAGTGAATPTTTTPASPTTSS